MEIKGQIKYIVIVGGLITWICNLDAFWTVTEKTLGITVISGIKTSFFMLLLGFAVLIFVWRFFVLIFELGKLIYCRIYEKGRAIGFIEGKEAAYHGRIDLYENVISQCQQFIEELSKHSLNELGGCLIKKLSEQPKSWEQYLIRDSTDYFTQLSSESKRKWQELVKATACKYIDATNAVRTGEKGPPFLLSNFNIYAEVVSAILETLATYDFGNYVRIWTLLNKPLPFWYNMLAISDEASKNTFYCTQNWWETYKEGVSALKSNEKIQMRRIIVDKQTDGKNMEELYIYKDNGRVQPMPIREARSKKTEFTTMKLIKDVQLALDQASDEVLNEKMYIIGWINDGEHKKANGQKNNKWIKLTSHFHQEYHNGFRQYLKDQKGVYYCFVEERAIAGNRDLSSYLMFDDIFLVEFNECDNHIDGFGITLNINEQYDIVGISLLTGNALNLTRKALKAKWETGVGSIQRSLK